MFPRELRSTACRRSLTAALFAAACLSFPITATALTIQTFNVPGLLPILGGDNPSFKPNVTIKFTFDETCMTSSCNLTIARSPTTTRGGSRPSEKGLPP